MDKQEAIKRLDALDAEAKALRAIIEAEPKKEPRGLCWVWDDSSIQFGWGNRRPVVIIGIGRGKKYKDSFEIGWDHAEPLTASEMQEYRGRWE